MNKKMEPVKTFYQAYISWYYGNRFTEINMKKVFGGTYLEALIDQCSMF